MKRLFIAAALVAALVGSTAQAKPFPVLTAAKVANVYARDPIPPQFDPATHAMPSNLYVSYLDHRHFLDHCHDDRYGCEIGPADSQMLTAFYIFIDVDQVPPALRAAVLRHEKAHVLGWRH